MRLNADQLEEFVRPVIEAQTEPTLEPIAVEYLMSSWRAMMNSDAVAYGSDAGFLLGFFTTDVMTGKRKAYEYLWMLRPDKRSNGEGLKLLAEFEEGAKHDGCVAVVVGNSAGYKPAAMRRMYRRLGYSSISESFQRTFDTERTG